MTPKTNSLWKRQKNPFFFLASFLLYIKTDEATTWLKSWLIWGHPLKLFWLEWPSYTLCVITKCLFLDNASPFEKQRLRNRHFLRKVVHTLLIAWRTMRDSHLSTWRERKTIASPVVVVVSQNHWRERSKPMPLGLVPVTTKRSQFGQWFAVLDGID